MLRTLVGLLLLVILVLPTAAQVKKKPDVDVDKDDAKAVKGIKKKPDVDVDKDEPKAVSDSKKKLTAAGKIAGKLTQVEGSQKYLTVQVTAKVSVPNPQAMHTMASLQAQLTDAARRRDFNRVADLNRQLAQQQPYQLKDHNLKFELVAADDMKVRTMLLPADYDEKGKPRKYTKKELDELKGPDPKLPGYAAEFDCLRPGQEVEVQILRPKTTAPAKAKPKDKDRDVVAEDERLKATMVLILGNPREK